MTREAATPTGLRYGGAPVYEFRDGTFATNAGIKVPAELVAKARAPKPVNAPPIITMEGWPALPGESARDYHQRVHDTLLARQDEAQKSDLRWVAIVVLAGVALLGWLV